MESIIADIEPVFYALGLYSFTSMTVENTLHLTDSPTLSQSHQLHHLRSLHLLISYPRPIAWDHQMFVVVVILIPQV